MRQQPPIFDSGDASAGRPQDEYEAASASTEIGSQSGDDDLKLPVLNVLFTFLFIIVAVVTAALIAMVI